MRQIQPKFNNLIALQALGLALRLLGPNWAPVSVLVTLLSTAALIIKIRLHVKQRYESHKVFERGNIPSLENKNPFSGNLFEIIEPGNNLEIMHQNHKKLGKTYGIFYGPDPWALSTDLDLLQVIFENTKNVDITQFRLPFTNEFGKSLAQVQGNEWRRIRRLLNPSFAHKQMKTDNVFRDIEDACERMMQSIENHSLEERGSDKKSRIIDALQCFKNFSVDVIFRIAFGTVEDMKQEVKDKLIEEVHAASKIVRSPEIWTCIMFDEAQPFFGRFIKFTQIGRLFNRIHSVLEKSLATRRQLLLNGAAKQGQGGSSRIDGSRKMMDTIIERIDSEQLDDETLKANLFFIFVAGFETSANTLAIMFWLLARHPEAQEKLRQAIKSEGERASYLDWCIKETLRLYPAVPAAVGRILSEDLTTNKKQKFFKGTTVVASIYSIHHCDEYWGTDVEEFRPDRFGQPLTHPNQFFAFGFGVRDCIGKNLAMAEMRAIVTRLMLKYSVNCCSKTPEKIEFTSPNLIHMIIEGRIDLRFTELS